MSKYGLDVDDHLYFINNYIIIHPLYPHMHIAMSLLYLISDSYQPSTTNDLDIMMMLMLMIMMMINDP